jgi:hypothetical protein
VDKSAVPSRADGLRRIPLHQIWRVPFSQIDGGTSSRAGRSGQRPRPPPPALPVRLGPWWVN